MAIKNISSPLEMVFFVVIGGGGVCVLFCFLIKLFLFFFNKIVLLQKHLKNNFELTPLFRYTGINENPWFHPD